MENQNYGPHEGAYYPVTQGRFGYRGDPRFAPLSAWSYFGYTLLFCIPLVGLILLIVFSCSSDNINRRSYARSFWIPLFLLLVILIALFIFVLPKIGAAYDAAMKQTSYATEAPIVNQAEDDSLSANPLEPDAT